MTRNFLLDSDPTGGGTGGAGVAEMVDGFQVRPGGVMLDLDKPQVRELAQTVVAQFNERQQKRAKARNQEILDVVKERCKDHSQRVGSEKVDGREEKFYVGDRMRALATEYMGKDPDKYPDHEVRSEFKQRVNELIENSVKAPNQRGVARLPEELAGECSFGRLLGNFARSVADGDKTPLSVGCLRKINCGAEAEADEEMRHRSREIPGSSAWREAAGVHLPMNSGVPGPKALRGTRRAQRDALAYDFGTAGALVPTDFLQIEELLRNEIVLSHMGATWLGGLGGDLLLPRAMSATTGQSVPEGMPLAQYDQSFDQLRLSPHRYGTSQYYSRLAMIQTAETTNLAAYILQYHMEVMGLYADHMGLNGTGANDQPLGLLNQPGISQTIFGGTPSYSQIRGFVTNIRKFNVKGPVAFVTTSVGRGRLAVLPATLVGSTVVSGTTNALWVDSPNEDGGRLIGCMGMDSQQIPGDILVGGVWKYVLIGQWGGINVLLNPYSRDDRDEWKLTLNGYMDVAVRRAQAFNRSGDSANQ